MEHKPHRFKKATFGRACLWSQTGACDHVRALPIAGIRKLSISLFLGYS
jgi:hypothetical protein